MAHYHLGSKMASQLFSEKNSLQNEFRTVNRSAFSSSWPTGRFHKKGLHEVQLEEHNVTFTSDDITISLG